MEITLVFNGSQLCDLKREHQLESVTKDIIEPAFALLPKRNLANRLSLNVKRVREGKFVKIEMNDNPLQLQVYIEVNEEEILRVKRNIEAQEEFINGLKTHYMYVISELKKKHTGDKLEKKLEVENKRQEKALKEEDEELENLNIKLKSLEEEKLKEFDELHKFANAKGMQLLKVDQILKVELGEAFDRGEILLEKAEEPVMTAPAPQAIQVKEAAPALDAELVGSELATPVPAPVVATEEPNIFDVTKAIISQETAARAAAIASEATESMAEVAAAAAAPETTPVQQEILQGFKEAVEEVAPAVDLSKFPREKGGKKGIGKFKK
jgi:predicted RNase H-like nuclease (RuvC/YqgF family)